MREKLPAAGANVFLACGDAIVPVEIFQAGVFSCVVSPQSPGQLNLFLTFDGNRPISQVLLYEFCVPLVPNVTIALERNSNREEFQLQMRLAHLLFSSKTVSIFSSKVSEKVLKEAKAFAHRTSQISAGWAHLAKMIGATVISFPEAKESLFELILKNRLQEWLLEQVVAGCKITEPDEQGQGVIHLCDILGYTWAVYPYSCFGISLDYRDKCGWTALHWAAYYGREKMVAALLSAAAEPNLITDPTSENPGGCTAADLASINGYDVLCGYLAEKALVSQFNDMTLAAGCNVSGSPQTTANGTVTLGGVQ